MIPKIFPRNLTARAITQVVGNPATTRLESGVGNCFPGLEFDHRNLDRRFFPGLVFEFTSNGVRLVTTDMQDPALDEEASLKKDLADSKAAQFSEGAWFLEQITQGGATIAMSQDLDPMTAWRLVRCLEPGKVTIELQRRALRAGETVPPQTVRLSANRRSYVDATTGVIGGSYAPGELTQSLCSPWMHDFRDCACFYWASNHPDIVLAEDPPGQPTLPSGAPEDPFLALTPIDWLRRDRTSTAPVKASEADNRPKQMDHYEINQRWQDLAIVLRGREISSIYQLREEKNANPLPSPDALAARLMKLAELEHAVALEYLYARYSLKNPDDATGTLKSDLTFVQHEVFLVAVSEMRHLRWANQIIWSLEHADLLTKRVGPSLGIANEIPVAPVKSRPPQLPSLKGVHPTRPPQLRPLLPKVLQDFIAVEQPSGFLDGQYAEVLATLRQTRYPETLEQLAARIIADGMEHFSRFRQIQVVLRNRKPGDYLRSQTFPPAKDGDPDGAAAHKTYTDIIEELKEAYASGDMEDAAHIARARTLMFQLDEEARKLAAKSRGVPFFPTGPVKPATGKRNGNG